MVTNKEKKFAEVAQILARCEQLKSDIRSFLGENSQIYRRAFNGNNDLLGRSNVYFFQLFVLQICMILFEKEHHHLRTLATKFLLDPNTNWTNENSKVEVGKAIDWLKEIENEVGDTFRTLRDKHFAHRDFNRDLKDVALSYEVAWRVLLNFQELFNIINYHVFNRTVRFEILDREPVELKHLARFARIWVKLMPEWAKQHNGPLLDVIYMIKGKTPPNQ
ncbi:MAG: hypothetical protein ABIO93_32945 [Dyadobacter sp.]|uniref:hypothetical protein n=1 Tax=Dyadobacter sp. TaxID=1914288 RepID=UPI0032664C6C